MGAGKSWTEIEDCALARSYAAVVVDVVTGTDQKKKIMWRKVHDGFKIVVGEEYLPDKLVTRTARALEGRWPTIAQGVHAFKDVYRRLRKENLTGNLDEEDLISAASAVVCGMGAYHGVRSDREKDKKRGKSHVRQAKPATCDFVGCWRLLRHLDKFSGAASTTAAGLPPPPPPSPADDEDVTSDDDRVKKAAASGDAYAPAPQGIKATKRDRNETRTVAKAVARESSKSAEALERIAQSSNTRAMTAFFFSPQMAGSAATAQFITQQTALLLGQAALQGPDVTSDDDSAPHRKKRSAVRARRCARTPPVFINSSSDGSSSSHAVAVITPPRRGEAGPSRTPTPQAARRTVDLSTPGKGKGKGKALATRASLTMETDSDMQIVPITSAPAGGGSMTTSGALSFSPPRADTTAPSLLLQYAPGDAPLPVPAHPMRLAARPLPTLPTPLSRGAKAMRTKQAAAVGAAQPSTTIHIDLTASGASDVDATDAVPAAAVFVTASDATTVPPTQ